MIRRVPHPNDKRPYPDLPERLIVEPLFPDRDDDRCQSEPTQATPAVDLAELVNKLFRLRGSNESLD